MTKTLSPASELDIDLDDVSRVVDADGVRVANPDLDPWIAEVSDETVRSLYRDMALLRRVDNEGIALQRQGQLGLWPPCQGQEAVQIGTARALRDGDFAFPSYRETGVVYARGGGPASFVLAWRGEEHAAFDPFDLGVAPPQIIIGAQALHAVGYAMGIQRDGSDDVAAAYFGDGATSQGDVSEAMIFAASFRAPVVFVCSNNHYAISEPVTLQSRFPIAGRAPGFGIPSMRVDGNDVLACFAAMHCAIDRARRGEGPTFIEAVTYRIGPHTTSDDPSRYRDKAEVESWRRRDPITRLEAYLRSRDAFDDTFAADVADAADALAAEVRAACLDAQTRPALSIFDAVYAEPHSGLDEQRAQYAAYLDGFDDRTDSEAASR